MNGFVIAIHLDAKGSSCKRMLRVARNLDGLSVCDFNQKPAGIRAIIRANGTLNLSHHENLLFPPLLKYIPCQPWLQPYLYFVPVDFIIWIE
jgi:hypothetical protein